jgi:hypothetical protein
VLDIHADIEKEPHFWSILRMSKIEELGRCYLTAPSLFERGATLNYDTRCLSNLWTAPKDANSINMAHSNIEGGASKKNMTPQQYQADLRSKIDHLSCT